MGRPVLQPRGTARGNFFAILASTLGIETTEEQRAKHLANHVGYLQSWVEAIRNDPMAVVSAAKDAEQMAKHIMGIEQQKAAMSEHKEGMAEYEAAVAPTNRQHKLRDSESSRAPTHIKLRFSLLRLRRLR